MQEPSKPASGPRTEASAAGPDPDTAQGTERAAEAQSPAAGTHDDDGPTSIPRELAGRDPATTPDDERLINITLRWIAYTCHRGPMLSRWAQYAAEASGRLHPSGHHQRQRAVLADAAVRTGLLPLFGSAHRAASAIASRITDLGDSPADASSMLDHLHAYLALHNQGLCPLAHQGLRHTPVPAERDDGPRPALLTTVIVAVAMAGACARDDLAGFMLDAHTAQLELPGSAGRALFATLALALTDQLYEPHRSVCTQTGRRAPDRHRFSALLYGEPPTRHRSPAPADTAPPPPDANISAMSCEVSLDGVWYGLSAHTQALLTRRRLLAKPTTSNVWLICDTCRLALRLGSSIVHSAHPDTLTVPIIAAGNPAWQHPDVSRATWRLLSEHPNHELRVLTDVSPAWRKYAATPTDIIASPGTDPRPDTALGDYNTGWPGPPTPTVFTGATPALPEEPVNGEVSLICLSCRLELALGRSTGQPGAALTIGARPAVDQAIATTAVFRMLTEHTGHDLAIFNDAGPWDQYIDSGEWDFTIEPGDDFRPPLLGDITHRQYIEGWPEAPTLRHYRGADPLDPPPGRSPGTPA
ncbi:hypothetical protein GCM10020358_68850 [Amorphoplanes nipponensis]|uniref:Uncharacterized protein n=1 Tax=Actinoplanes nipponensis TaxID=135950 RepID=A0A919JR85_9ACTN|nr:hypothetical protein [Actinoplanes nipponensis]GIE51489.1 hypothetical protein Ani05nite_50230 [Actinoplanes nipponensis]